LQNLFTRENVKFYIIFLFLTQLWYHEHSHISHDPSGLPWTRPARKDAAANGTLLHLETPGTTEDFLFSCYNIQFSHNIGSLRPQYKISFSVCGCALSSLLAAQAFHQFLHLAFRFFGGLIQAFMVDDSGYIGHFQRVCLLWKVELYALRHHK
jgi:hypothetical protein